MSTEAMSLRRRPAEASQADQIRSEIGDLEKIARQIECDANVQASVSDNISASAEFEKLSATEKSAASLGVNPEEWKPISFMNDKHYDQLKAQNMLDGDLARRIEAYRVVSAK